MSKILSDNCIEAGWNAERESMIEWAIKEKKFNPETAPKFISNFIETMVFCKLPCTSKAGIIAAAEQWRTDRC